jgi:hypothetical protein
LFSFAKTKKTIYLDKPKEKQCGADTKKLAWKPTYDQITAEKLEWDHLLQSADFSLLQMKVTSPTAAGLAVTGALSALVKKAVGPVTQYKMEAKNANYKTTVDGIEAVATAALGNYSASSLAAMLAKTKGALENSSKYFINFTDKSMDYSAAGKTFFTDLKQSDLDKVKQDLADAYTGTVARNNLGEEYEKLKASAGGKSTSKVDDYSQDPKLSGIDGKTLSAPPKGIPSTPKYELTTSKKGQTSKDKLKQLTGSKTQQDVNRTNTYTKDNQTDRRTNRTNRYETPRLFTNRTGYVKSAWTATDKFAAWEVVGAVDALLAGATMVNADTGSVGRVGQGTDAPQYGGSQINYMGATKPPITGGH